MVLSLKLDIGGHEPTIMYNAPVTIYYLAKAIKSNGEHARTLKN